MKFGLILYKKTELYKNYVILPYFHSNFFLYKKSKKFYPNKPKNIHKIKN